MELSALIELRDYALKLSSGIDPTSDWSFAEDTILNSQRIKKYNRTVCELLNTLIQQQEEAERSLKQNPTKKPPFTVLDEELQFVEIFEEAISISKFVYAINGKFGKDTKKLHAYDITSWLEKKQYLKTELISETGRYYKIVTRLGRNIGIETETKINSYGNVYYVNLYNVTAQKFVRDHLQSILRTKSNSR